VSSQDNTLEGGDTATSCVGETHNVMTWLLGALWRRPEQTAYIVTVLKRTHKNTVCVCC